MDSEFEIHIAWSKVIYNINITSQRGHTSVANIPFLYLFQDKIIHSFVTRQNQIRSRWHMNRGSRGFRDFVHDSDVREK